MNRNYFLLSKTEYEFLLMSESAETAAHFGVDPELWDDELLDACLSSLLEKRFLIRHENKVERDSLLDAWMYVVTHSTDTFTVACPRVERLTVYFYRDSIVSVHLIGEICELIWFPFINLALGQLAKVVSTGNYLDCECGCSHRGRQTWKFEPDGEMSYLAVMQEMAKHCISAHGEAMRGGAADESV